MLCMHGACSVCVVFVCVWGCPARATLQPLGPFEAEQTTPAVIWALGFPLHRETRQTPDPADSHRCVWTRAHTRTQNTHRHGRADTQSETPVRVVTDTHWSTHGTQTIQQAHKGAFNDAQNLYSSDIRVSLSSYTQAVLTLNKHFSTWAADITMTWTIVSAALGECACVCVSGESNKRNTVKYALLGFLQRTCQVFVNGWTLTKTSWQQSTDRKKQRTNVRRWRVRHITHEHRGLGVKPQYLCLSLVL